MAKIVNLTRARKTRDRAAKKAAADANAAKHGQSKAERVLQAARDDRAKKLLDGHEREEP